MHEKSYVKSRRVCFSLDFTYFQHDQFTDLLGLSDTDTYYYCKYKYIFKTIYLSIYLSIYSCCSHLEHRASVKRLFHFNFLKHRPSIGLVGRGVSPHKTATYTRQYKHRIKVKNIHALIGIRTRDPNVQAGEDCSRPRPRGHCDRHF
jgi:hypothetical protein